MRHFSKKTESSVLVIVRLVLMAFVAGVPKKLKVGGALGSTSKGGKKQ